MILTFNGVQYITDFVFEWETNEHRPSKGWYIRLTERDNFTGPWNTPDDIKEDLNTLYRTLAGDT